ncbi:EAL domain-containing response regulator [Pseudomonas sp. J452]|uniref:EAL domain-containing response regulator n=1 Tax=Pseudomonas sp. J452 TaxID=2898441 RepID=UPI0021AE06E0|nr:EAL domain-containing response regulator [Pseudomonas sp. J452]UUY08127.1 EAL domain-containing response regulator [Pseudomonas sp. J452]
MSSKRLPRRVLIVDDSTPQRQFADELCHELGIEQRLQAVDGLQAMALLREDAAIEAILLDLEMPEFDGVQVLQEIVRLGLNPAVVVVSGRESVLLATVERMTQNLGVNLLGVLQKPLNYDQLATSLGRFVGREAPPVVVRSSIPTPTQDDILHALQHDEFKCFVQPKVALADGSLSGVEALIRWQHPQHGLLAPAAFLTPLEQGPHLGAVTLQMLDKALQHCRSWQLEGLKPSVSVNLSPRSLGDECLADAIISRVSASGIAPYRVILEVTESAIVSDPDSGLATLARLRLHGLRLSVDDYGTGYSSMLRLLRAPFSELKVDRAFVHGASANQHLRVLLESALGLGERLGLCVVAEGVETLEDWQLLRELDCAEAQGYFIAKPMEGEALPAWWRANQKRLQRLGKLPAPA